MLNAASLRRPYGSQSEEAQMDVEDRPMGLQVCIMLRLVSFPDVVPTTVC